MAITATWTNERTNKVGRETHKRGFFTLAGSATAGGFAITAATFGLSVLNDFAPEGGAMVSTAGITAMLPAYDKTAGTVTLFEGSASATIPFDESNIADTTGFLVRGTARGQA